MQLVLHFNTRFYILTLFALIFSFALLLPNTLYADEDDIEMFYYVVPADPSSDSGKSIFEGSITYKGSSETETEFAITTTPSEEVQTQPVQVNFHPDENETIKANFLKIKYEMSCNLNLF